ncbi:MAG: Ig-like domain-containing protein [Alphaproteobacteria bacterium]|nr:Ig-like domain-containing protein [Alphaproteobacteria bacterium]
MHTTLVVALVGCGGTTPELMLEGEPHVRVQELGEVEAPIVRLSDGSVPEGLVWSVSEERVASIRDDGRVIAAGEGSTQITGSWQGQSVSWQLEVEPDFVLRFERIPASVAIGETHQLVVIAELGGQSTPPTAVVYVSSAPEILSVDGGGLLKGESAGTAYVTASGHGGRAMAEIAVVAE